MSAPWDDLGLTRGEAADPAAVKRAYARLLRQHRPDRDPEGFRRIRDAYEALTGAASPWRAVLADADDAADAEPEQAEPEAQPPSWPAVAAAEGPKAPVAASTPTGAEADRPRPPPVPGSGPGRLTPADPLRVAAEAEAALARLGHGSVDDGQDPQRLAELRELRSALVAAGIGAAEIEQRIVTAVGPRDDLLEGACDEAFLIDAVAGGGGAAMRRLVEAWRRQRRWRRLAVLAQVWLVQRGASAPDAEIWLVELLAEHLILPEMALATALIERLPGARQAVLRAGHAQRLGVGTELSHMPPELRHQLAEVLVDGRVPGGAAAARALSGRLEGLPAASALRVALDERVPDLPAPKSPAAPVSKTYRPVRSGRAAASGRNWIWLILVGLLIVSNAGRCASTSSSTTISPMPQTPAEEARRRFRQQMQQLEQERAQRTVADPESDATRRRILQQLNQMEQERARRTQVIPESDRGAPSPAPADHQPEAVREPVAPPPAEVRHDDIPGTAKVDGFQGADWSQAWRVYDRVRFSADRSGELNEVLSSSPWDGEPTRRAFFAIAISRNQLGEDHRLLLLHLVEEHRDGALGGAILAALPRMSARVRSGALSALRALVGTPDGPDAAMVEAATSAEEPPRRQRIELVPGAGSPLLPLRTGDRP